ncbi:hypothetical protein BDM02DRAFT_3114285 [Thelephora ganbajun]|uniref:Uncharacterized protein n=1 Tax=Thelephora ganbajun TaxID=370292 RepID=A0ACB6ZIE7_THEGA|nr:hypothetical protein BDM02DRAFT_3114285 [Thelephora ganbajun]
MQGLPDPILCFSHGSPVTLTLLARINSLRAPSAENFCLISFATVHWPILVSSGGNICILGSQGRGYEAIEKVMSLRSVLEHVEDVTRLRDSYKDYLNRRYPLSIFKNLPHSSQLSTPTLMSSHPNQSSAFHHYVPNSGKYHVQHTPQTISPSPARMGALPPPPPQIRKNLPSSDPCTKSWCRIEPAPTTTSMGDPTSLPTETSSSHGNSSGQKQHKFVQYSPR